MAQTPEAISQARMTRGLALLESKGKHISENQDGSFQVPSQTSANVYEVRLICEKWVCTCPDFENRQIDSCKHIFAVRMMIATKTYLKDEPKPKVFADDATPCDRCGSIRVIRFGFDSGKQTFYCKDCKHKFRQASPLKKAKFSPDLVTLTLDLYFSGLSLRKITRTVADHLKIDIHYSTIYTWIQRYIPMISEYVNKLEPQLSKQWHADELFVRVRGGTHQGRPIGFVWNIMDRETRFLIVSKLTCTRTAIDCAAAFEDAQARAHGIEPDVVFTDSLRHYKSGVQILDHAKRVDNCGLMKQNNNNRIERLNGTLRERVKVQRGLKTVKTVVTEGQRLHYDFVKPHQALAGKTPAESAGLDVNGWKELLEKAVKK